jgi:KaiC/GvpD/RAD55 family RecA-like ATPase
MTQIHMDDVWMRELLPRGWPAGTSTVITGAGGSGKPLIGQAVAGSWLRHGGSVVFMSLQYPSHEFVVEGLRRIGGLELADCAERVAFLGLDAEIAGLVVDSPGRIRANLVIPQVWDEAVEAAATHVPGGGPGTLIFGSALNLLLFSPTYGSEILGRMKRTLVDVGDRSTLFAVSNSAKAEQVAELEDLADNLLISNRIRDPFRLSVRIERMKGVKFNPEPVEIPIPPETLAEVKAIADHSRRRVIPVIMDI